MLRSCPSIEHHRAGPGWRGGVATSQAIAAVATGVLLVASTQVATARSQAAIEATWPDRPPDGWLSSRDVIRISLDRPLAPSEGRLAIVIGDADWTGLCDIARDGLVCRPSVVSLPQGERELSLHLVAREGVWREIARWPLKVRLPGGFERATATPAVEVQFKGQPRQRRTPALPPTDRDTYRDTSLSASFGTTLLKNGWTTRGSVALLGASYAPERLRFGQLQQEAPAVDLATYLVSAESAHGRVTAGHVQFNPHRHLVADFGARGVSALLRPARALDIELGATSATSLVGWSTPLGFTSSDHRVFGLTVGVEAVPRRPGALRIAGSVVDGQRRPQAGVTQGLVSDAQRSRGAGLRVLSSAGAERFSLDAGIARTRFESPDDAGLAQGLALTRIDPTTRSARFVDASFAVVHNARIGQTQSASVVVGGHHEQVDPLYRSVAAASVQSDQQRNAVDMTVSLGPASARVSHERSRDNLADIGSILTTRNHKWEATAMVPLGGLGRPTSSPWLPLLGYQWLRLHQAGDGLPVNAGFDSLSQVPDQLNTIHAIGVDWQRVTWRAGYRHNRSFQDNRQVGRAAADFLNATNVISFGLMPSTAMDIGLEVGFDGAENRETAREDLTRRLAVTATLRPTRLSTLTALVTRTRVFDRAATSRSTNTDLSVQFGQSVPFVRRRPDGASAQAFIRFARQTLSAFDRVFAQSNSSQAWVLNTGLTIRVQ
jgi:hypothetical protein